jgi:hypothetical protein
MSKLWEFRKDGFVYDVETNERVCSPHSTLPDSIKKFGPHKQDLIANGRLIAAAPRMLELLKRLLPIAEDAAESLGRFCSDEGWAQEDMDRMDNVDGMLPLIRAAIKAVEEKSS